MTRYIRRNSFRLSPKGRVICLIENIILLVLASLLLSALFVAMSYLLFLYKPLSITGIRILSFSVIIICALTYIIIGLTHDFLPVSLFFWRFFKPDRNSINIYIENEEKRIQKLILRNQVYIQRLKNNQEIYKNYTEAEISSLAQTNITLMLKIEALKDNAVFA